MDPIYPLDRLMKPPFFKTWVWLFLFLLTALSTSALQTPATGTCFVYPSPATGNQAYVVFNMPQSGTATVWVYNEAGDLATVVDQYETAGVQQTSLDLTYFHRGIYLCRVTLNFDAGGNQTLPIFKFMVRR